MIKIEAPETVAENEGLWKVVSQELERRHAEVLYEVVRKDPHSLRYIPRHLITQGLCIEAVSLSSAAIRWVPFEIMTPAIRRAAEE